MAANNGPPKPSKWGKWTAILVILAAVIVAVWLLGPISGLIGLFVIPAANPKAKELESNEKAQILAADPTAVLASQPSDVRAGVAAENASAVSSALDGLKADSARNIAALIGEGIPSSPTVTVTVGDSKGS